MPTPEIPARQVLTSATATNERLGHENLGFLSESHGFMPREQPLLHLPPTHHAWDALAAQLPELFRGLTLRESLDRMPILDAGEQALSDAYVLRASAILSIFAHAYYYVTPDPAARIPESILRPWGQISQRLQRPAPHLSFIDLNVYNWKLIGARCADPMRVENLELLIPIVGNEDERRFQATPIEMLAQFTPALGAVVRAQEAAARDDAGALKRELLLIADTLKQLAYESFMKVNPNAYSRLYVNPVVWGKTVAPLATPYQPESEGIPGPSGTAIPAFQLLDSFFARQTYTTSIGAETARVRPWFPPHWRDLLTAVEQICVPDYVARSGDSILRGIFREAIDAYAGETGLLGRHRIKTYGFLDLSFKAGRSKTLGGFGGGFDDRLWDKMDGELDLARMERYTRYPQTYHYVRVKRAENIRTSERESISRVVLDVSGTGIRYQPGDRCAILPENSDELIEQTLRALRASGEVPIQLNAGWRQAVKLREGHELAKVLSLRSLLKFGRIRPVSRPIAKALYSITHSETLWRIIEARAEDQWELWELLDMLAQTGFNPKRLWKAYPGERESICWIVPPESFRMYSIASAMEDPSAESAAEIHLMVGRLAYETPATAVSIGGSRHGTTSNFLARMAETSATRASRITIKTVHPPRFSLPSDVTRPILMFAGGTGLAPFLSLLRERARQAGAGENWLFWGTRTRADLVDQSALNQMISQGKLHLRVACSQDDIAIRSADSADGDQLIVEPGHRQYIGELMSRAEQADQIWQLLRSVDDGGRGASIYVCGRIGFANSVFGAITAILERYADGPATVRRERARQVLHQLIGEDRYMQEIFTTYTGPQFEQGRSYDASEVVEHNNDQDGYWMIISGRVYDLTEFAHIHPGGLKIIRSYAGIDATNAYQKVLHDVNPEVDAMLGMYEIGVVRRLNLGRGWAVAIGSKGLQFIVLKDVYRAWVQLLYQTVEMENALHNDYGIRQEPVTYNETPGITKSSPYKTQLLLQTHQRFVQEYLAKLTGEALEQLWAISSALHSEHLDVGWMAGTIAAIQQTEAAHTASQLGATVAERLNMTQSDRASDLPAIQWCEACCELLEQADKQFLREIKQALRSGVTVFEQLESETIARGSKQLLDAVSALPVVLERYYARVAS